MIFLTKRLAQEHKRKLSLLNVGDFVKIIIWLGFYRILLDIIYCDFVAIRWAFYGFICETPSSLSYVGSWFLTLLTALCLTQLTKLRTFSSVLLQCLLILVFLPGVVLYTYIKEAETMYPYYLLYWCVFIVLFFIICGKKPKPIQFLTSNKLLLKLSVLIFFFCFFIWGVFGRFHLQLDIIDVYGQREIASSYGMPLLFTYLFASVQTCIPFLAIWALTQKEKIIFCVNIMAQLMAFFTTGSKSTFFSLLVGVFTYLVFKNDNGVFRSYTLKIIKGMIALEFFSIIENIYVGTNFLIDVIIRRLLFLPNLLNIYYFDFFSNHEFDYFRSTILRFFTTRPLYNDKIQKVIGDIYFNRPNMYTNNGLFSDAYMNLGYVGIIIMPLLIVILFCIFDKCIGEANISLMIASMIYIIFALTGSSLFTNLLSHGFLMLAFLFLFVDKKDPKFIRLGRN